VTHEDIRADLAERDARVRAEARADALREAAQGIEVWLDAAHAQKRLRALAEEAAPPPPLWTADDEGFLHIPGTVPLRIDVGTVVIAKAIADAHNQGVRR
jgi:hypothetical protein